MAPHRDLGFGAEHGILELHGDVFAQIGAALSAAAAASAAAKNLSQAEEVAEDVAEVGGVEARSGASAQSGVAEAVVDVALFRIRQYCVSFTALFEFFFRIGIVGIAVRMELQRQFAVGALEFLLGCRAGYAQNLIVVAFSVAGQNGLSNPFGYSR